MEHAGIKLDSPAGQSVMNILLWVGIGYFIWKLIQHSLAKKKEEQEAQWQLRASQDLNDLLRLSKVDQAKDNEKK
jgi:threonine/homoserine/homoserine lactone efflux protein